MQIADEDATRVAERQNCPDKRPDLCRFWTARNLRFDFARITFMNHSPIYTFVVGLLPCLIPPYALRLKRVFGTQRVGWLLFTVFSLLAVLQVVRFWHPMGLGLDAGVMLDLFYLLIPFLLLTGMVHIETLFKERMRTEQEEKRMRNELEAQVKERTVE